MNDTINALFEFGAAVFIFNHCRVLYADKMVRGASVLSTVFFFSWGIWNIWYYPSLHQMASFIAGLFVVTANGLWITLMVYYTRAEKLRATLPHTTK